MASTALTYSSESVMSETVVSSVLSVTGTPARWSLARGCAAIDGTMPACQFEVGHRSSADPAGTQLGAQLRIVDRARAVRDPLGLDREGAADLRGAAPLPGVDRDPQAERPGGLERAGVVERVREGGLGAGQVPAGQPLVDEPAAVSASSTFPSASWERRAVQIRRTTVPVRVGPAARAGAHGRDAVGQGQAARHVQPWSPADLDVAHAIGGLRLDELDA